jgi:hypothetical protein
MNQGAGHCDQGEHHEEVVLNRGCDKVIITIEIQERCDEGEAEDGGQGPKRPEGPIATPFLVIPCRPGDLGARPLALDQALASQGIEVVIANPETNNWAAFELQLSCQVANLGAGVCAAGLAEFYIGEQFGIWYPGHDKLTPAQVKAGAHLIGRATFAVPPGATIKVPCPKLWKPGSGDSALKGLLVQVSDLFTDPIMAPFDGIGDRHVARNDEFMDPMVN